MTKVKVITTVGTSLFTNYMRDEVNDYLKNITDDRGISTPFSSLEKRKDSNNRHKKDIKKCIIPHWIEDIERYEDNNGEKKYKKAKGLNIHCCAEVQTLVNLAKDDKYKGKDLEVYLLATDTQLSQLAAEIIEKDIFNKTNSLHPNIKVVENQKVDDLNVTDSTTFEEKGFFNLIEKVKEIKGKDEVILNISGGYKALIPPLTIVAQLYDIELTYMYEDSDNIISIASLPIQFDWNIVEEIAPYLNDFYLKDRNSNTEINNHPKIIKALKNYGLISNSSFPYKKTFIGKLIHDYAEDKYFTSAKSTLSHIVEYKFIEYYTENIYKSNNIAYDAIPIRSYELKDLSGNTKTEIDIILEDNSSNYIAIEVKSIGSLIGQIGKVKHQLENQLNYISDSENKGKLPQEFHYILYQVLKATPINSRILKSKLRELRVSVESKCGRGSFKAYLFDINRSRNQKGMYNDLLNRIVDKRELKEIYL